MTKYAEVIAGEVVTISFDRRTGWPEVPDTTFPGDIDNGDGTFLRPDPLVLTDEERRAAMPPITAQKFIHLLIDEGKYEEDVEAVIDAISDKPTRAKARASWKRATQFERDHPLISQIGPALGFTDERIDELWEAATTQTS